MPKKEIKVKKPPKGNLKKMVKEAMKTKRPKKTDK